MDVGKAFGFVFEDEDWIVKILIGAAILVVGILFSWLLLVPLILAFALLGGYTVEITRRVIRGNPQVLPEWEDWGALIADGLKVIVIGIVYALPIFVISLCLGIPTGILAEGGDVANVLSGLLGTGMGCLIFLWSIFISLLLPAAIAFYVANDDLSAAFRFGSVFAFVRDNLTTYLLTMLLSWVTSFVGGLGSIVCGLGLLVTAPYGWMVTGHLYGQAYLQAAGQASPPVAEESA